jgi:hypothetical protein
MCEHFGVLDVVHMDPLKAFSGRRQSAPRARSATRTINMTFAGSAAAFQYAVDNGYRVRLSIAQALGATGLQQPTDYNCKELKGLYPHADRSRDTAQKVSPKDYDLHHVIINSVSLVMPHNSMSQSVGIKTSTLPPVYASLKRRQTEDLAADLKLEMGDPDIVAHIPVSDKPDHRPIPILVEVVNGFHAGEVASTFGGITAQHMWCGIIPLAPELASKLGMRAPPASHAFPAPTDVSIQQAYNSWALVPMGHVLSHIANLPSSNVSQLGYEVHQLRMVKTNEPLPWLVMDLWTIISYITKTVENVIIPIDQNRVSIADQWVELVPLTDASWLRSCVAGREYEEGSVSFRLAVSYTAFPKGFREDPSLLPSLSAGFPKLQTEFRALIDSDDMARERVMKRAAAVMDPTDSAAVEQPPQQPEEMDQGGDDE